VGEWPAVAGVVLSAGGIIVVFAKLFQRVSTIEHSHEKCVRERESREDALAKAHTLAVAGVEAVRAASELAITRKLDHISDTIGDIRGDVGEVKGQLKRMNGGTE